MKPTTQPATGFETAAPQYNVAPQGKWSTGLFHCTSDYALWCMSFFFPYVTFGQIAEIVDRGSPPCMVSAAFYAALMHLTGCHSIYSSTYRSRLRQQYGMPAENCNDCCVHWCCLSCALRQEYRELQHRGFEPSLGGGTATWPNRIRVWECVIRPTFKAV